MDIHELWKQIADQAGTLTSVFLLTVFAGLVGYFKKKGEPVAPKDTVLSSIGMELGNRQQMDMLIAAVNRLGDIMENKKQASLEDLLKDIRDDMDDLKEHPRRSR